MVTMFNASFPALVLLEAAYLVLNILTSRDLTCLVSELLFDLVKNLRFVTKKRDELVITQGENGDW